MQKGLNQAFLLILSKKSPGLLRAAALNPFFRLRRFIRRNGSPFRAVSLYVLPPGNPEGERQRAVIPSKN